MTKSTERPSSVKTLDFHGCKMQQTSGDWIGECAFCGKAGKLHLRADEGLWDCKSCAKSGNIISFLSKLAEASEGNGTDAEWAELGELRALPRAVMEAVGVYRRKGFWWIPMRSAKGTVHDIRRYDFKSTMSTAGCESQLMGIERLAASKPGTLVHHCEGEWDGMAMVWLTQELERTKDVVVAVPGAGVFKDSWVEHYRGKDVVCYYDRDNAGDMGAEKAYKKLKAVAKSLRFVNWPVAKEDGYDLRDFVAKEGFAAGRVAKELWDELAALRQSAPPTMAQEEAKRTEDELTPLSLAEVLQVFRESILMSEDMEIGLQLMLATCMSNDVQGDPLWLYVVGPPGAGKTLLLASLATSSRCLFRSTVTPHSLISGWKQEGGVDPSLIPKLKGLTFVAKDFTEILTMPPLVQDEIFSTLRGAYDGTASKAFGNGVTREYKDCHFSMLAGVTHAIHGHKRASLGERFLKFGMRANDAASADATIAAAIGNVGKEKAVEERLQEACASFLLRKMDPAALPIVPRRYQERLTALVQLIAIMRANVERDFRTQEISYRPVPEAGTRLAKQLVKTAMCVAAVQDKKEVDDAVYSIVERVAYDTAHGFGLDALAALMEMGGTATRTEVGRNAKIPQSTLNRQFDDLTVLKAIERTEEMRVGGQDGGRPASLFRVNKHLMSLWERAKGDSCNPQKKTQSVISNKKLVLRRQ